MEGQKQVNNLNSDFEALNINVDGVDVDFKKFQVRTLEVEDYNKSYFDLLSQLTKAPKPNFEDWKKRFELIMQNKLTKIIVIEDIEKSKVIGSISLLMEYKFIRDLGVIGHIEDFVIDGEYRGQKFGKYMIEVAKNYAKEKGCYKILLDAKETVSGFYEKMGFKVTSQGLSIYF